MRKTKQRILSLVSDKVRPEEVNATNIFPFVEGDSYIATIVVSDSRTKFSSFAVAQQHTEDGDIVDLACSPATNEFSNQQEAYVLGALNIVSRAPRRAVIEVQTSSSYIVDGITKGRLSWSRNDWKKTDGKPIAYAEFWKGIDAAIKEKVLDVSATHIPKALADNHPVFIILKSFAETGRSMHKGDASINFAEEDDQ
ncbi:ribonuclease HI [Bradyrhizobium japonicum]